MRMIIVGFGTVGKSFARLVHYNRAELLRLFGLRPRIVAIIDKRGAAINPRGLNFEQLLKSKQDDGSVSSDKDFGRPGPSARDIINSLESDIVIEVTPTNLIDGEPGLSHIETALKRKCHVITANKGPLALAFPALMELATYNNVLLRFSGTVGGGTPILDLGKKGLLGDRVIAIKGILNGTTNYILTRMAESRVPMKVALKEAQVAGYAEADPSNDIEGLDSACKLVILANWVAGRHITMKDIDIEGITSVTLKDIENAKNKNCVIKLIAFINEKEASVKPQSLNKTHPLNVSGVLNAVTYSTEFAGEVTITGNGAGGIETASAILRDLIEIRKHVAI